MAKVIRNKKRMGAIQAALLSNLFYLVLGLLLNTAQGFVMQLSGGNSNATMVMQGVSLVLAVAFWIVCFWFAFRNLGEKIQEPLIKYIVLTMLPIVLFTVASSLIIHFAGGGFSQAWNSFAFVIAPTLFWYLPFGLVYTLVPSPVPITVFFALILILIVVFQLLGYGAGQGRRKRLKEEEKAIEENARLVAEKAAEPYNRTERKRRVPQGKRPQTNPGSDGAGSVPATHHSKKDPFETEDSPQIIYTEAFTAITDEMILEEEARRKEDLLKELPEEDIEEKIIVNVGMERDPAASPDKTPDKKPVGMNRENKEGE